jgi:hypothetical protein
MRECPPADTLSPRCGLREAPSGDDREEAGFRLLFSFDGLSSSVDIRGCIVVCYSLLVADMLPTV